LDSEVFRRWYELRNPITTWRQIRAYAMEGWAEMSETLISLAKDADLIICGTTYQEIAANVAEAKAIPLAALHYFPIRANNHSLPFRIPNNLVQLLWATAEWMHWRLISPAYNEQRKVLGLPVSKIRAVRRIVERGTLEIQAYDTALFPGLEESWKGRRPFVGTLTLGLPTSVDDAVITWIASGPPPVYFGFGSMPLDEPSQSIEMFVEVCHKLGKRALVCTGPLQFQGNIPHKDVMIVTQTNHSEVFSRCCAIVHHGGSGTTAASVRAGVPMLVLWVGADQPIWAGRIKRLGVGTARRFSSTTRLTLQQDLTTILAHSYTLRAREMAQQMTPIQVSVNTTADLLEKFVDKHLSLMGSTRQLRA
jgi:UDP:flavonoid glycosyltransferase YjiC (YdhE family)